MKRNLIFSLLAMLAINAGAQNPVSWNYTSKKIDGKLYEIRMTATLKEGWHLYSQKQPENAIATPTQINFSKNPLVILKGGIKEQGKMEKYTDPVLETEAYQYANKVEFIQQVTLKTEVSTNLSGSIGFQVCTDKHCLAPETINFNIKISNK